MTDLTMDRIEELERLIATKTQRKPDVATYGITAWDGLALIARAKRTEAAERERDAWRAFARGTDVWDYEGLCACCHETDHTPDCLWTIAALAQPTDAGGAE